MLEIGAAPAPVRQGSSAGRRDPVIEKIPQNFFRPELRWTTVKFS
jgi:hypothetical protein